MKIRVEVKRWFERDILLNAPPGVLLLHSTEIGDTAGHVRVLEIIGNDDGDET